MARKLFDGMGTGEAEQDKIEYRPPEEKDILVELFNKFIMLKNEVLRIESGGIWGEEDFESVVHTLESMIESAGGEYPAQLLIDTLSIRLRDESDGENDFSRTGYLTTVVQALYNLDYGNEFDIDIRNWSRIDYEVGPFLKGRPNKPLVLNLYGDFFECGYEAEYCEFTLYNEVIMCGDGAKHCNFTFYELCGMGGSDEAEHCTFSLMPGAKITHYLAKESKGNVRWKMDEEGEWGPIPPEELRR